MEHHFRWVSLFSALFFFLLKILCTRSLPLFWTETKVFIKATLSPFHFPLWWTCTCPLKQPSPDSASDLMQQDWRSASSCYRTQASILKRYKDHAAWLLFSADHKLPTFFLSSHFLYHLDQILLLSAILYHKMQFTSTLLSAIAIGALAVSAAPIESRTTKHTGRATW